MKNVDNWENLPIIGYRYRLVPGRGISDEWKNKTQCARIPECGSA